MKVSLIILAFAAMIFNLAQCAQARNVHNDLGGVNADYDAAVSMAAATGDVVHISGYCGSACTFNLALPPSQLCIAPGTRFGFHASAMGGLPNAGASNAVYDRYPVPLQKLINRSGGFSFVPTWIRGEEVAAALGIKCRR